MKHRNLSCALSACILLTLTACTSQGQGAGFQAPAQDTPERTNPLVTTGYFLSPLPDGYFIAYLEDENTSAAATVRSRTRAYVIWNAEGHLVRWGDSVSRVNQLQVLGDELVVVVAADDLDAGDLRNVILDPATGDELGEPSTPTGLGSCVMSACSTSDGWTQYDMDGDPLISFGRGSDSVSAFASDGSELWTAETSGRIIGGNAEHVAVWVERTGLVVVLDAATGEQVASIDQPIDSSSPGAAFVDEDAVALYDANRKMPTMYLYWF